MMCIKAKAIVHDQGLITKDKMYDLHLEFNTKTGMLQWYSFTPDDRGATGLFIGADAIHKYFDLNPSVSSGHECLGNMKQYIGFTEVYKYCTVCDKKAS